MTTANDEGSPAGQSCAKTQGGRKALLWPEGEILRTASEFLQSGGLEARRAIVKTMLELQRLLQEA